MAGRGQVAFWVVVLIVLAFASQHGANNLGQPTTVRDPGSEVAPRPNQPSAPPRPSKTPQTAPAATRVPATHFVTVDSLRVRDLPSTDGGVLGSLSRGDTVSVLGADGAWALVSLGADRRGWVNMQYLAAIGTGPPSRPAFQAPKTPPPPKQSKPEPKAGDPLRSAYVGTCDCPYDRKRNGARCGGTSAYSRPGGRSPACYVGD